MRLFYSVLFLMFFMSKIPIGQAESITDKTSGMKRFEGYFDFYWDETEGKIWLEIDKFDTEFLYVMAYFYNRNVRSD